MEERRTSGKCWGVWASGKGWGVAHDAELDGGLAVAQPARTCRIRPDPVGYGAHAADLEGRRPGRGVRWLTCAAWPKPTREERDGEKREDGKETRRQRREKGVVVTSTGCSAAPPRPLSLPDRPVAKSPPH